MKVNPSEEICPRIFCFDKNCGSLLLADIKQANLCSEISRLHLIINFYNFAPRKICIKAKILRMVEFHNKKLILGKSEQDLTYVHESIKLIFARGWNAGACSGSIMSWPCIAVLQGSAHFPNNNFKSKKPRTKLINLVPQHNSWKSIMV